MRFYEFAPQPNRPVLKISQQAATRANTTPTPFPRNTPPTATAPEPIKVYPDTWQHEWIQKHLAGEIAKSAQTKKPTADDLALASIRYAEAQRTADEEYERTHGVQRINRRWKKRR